jgi:hypothetical protein
MAVSPQEVSELTEKEKGHLVILEGIVDNHLKTTANPEHGASFFVPIPSKYRSMRSEVYDNLMDLYKKQGWKVELGIDHGVFDGRGVAKYFKLKK